ncbi:UNKNOWN [Stylonychia lemnae]|uniref:Nucleosome assembly protein n=1 Tax=Stylonychia lemnae TaxID=5949 RepID=A0A077ZQX4_STYLE|nr:UNKNOWN [Stylonychia lemnae]|eukprot:CDW71785.1 UNKNOWN [Stylonychia lemnae]
MSQTIEAMPTEVKDRFKALKVLYDQQMEIDEEEEKLYRELELKYDKLYQEVYTQRKQILLGTQAPPEALFAEYQARAEELYDEDYKKVEVNPIDVKDIQNTPLGVYGFWFKAMLNHVLMGRLIQEKDRPILMHLQDVECVLHTEGYGYDIVFTFEKNDYFSNETLKKTFVMTKQNVIEKCEGTVIAWKDGKDVTKKKVKKKNKKKGPKQNVVKTVEQESFFNFFKTIVMPDESELASKEVAVPKEGEEEEKDAGELMDADFDIGNEFKDQLIPLALEYFLEVIQEDEEDCEGCSDDQCDDHKNPDSDEDDDRPKKVKRKQQKGGDAAAAAGQQECKQQ